MLVVQLIEYILHTLEFTRDIESEKVGAELMPNPVVSLSGEVLSFDFNLPT